MLMKQSLTYKKLPSCNNCKYKFTHNNVNYCKLFKYIFVPVNHTTDYYIDTETARNNDELCGKTGKYFTK